jgi:four helix bundle protein
MGLSFENLDAWQSARELVQAVYGMTRDNDLSKDYGLRDQIQRAAVSTMSNIAEGFERIGAVEKAHFYNIARASAGEVRSLIYVIEDTYPHLVEMTPSAKSKAITTGKLISGLIASTRRRAEQK